MFSVFSLPFHSNDGKAGGEFRLWISRNDRGSASLTRRSPVEQEDLDTMTPISQHKIDYDKSISERINGPCRQTGWISLSLSIAVGLRSGCGRGCGNLVRLLDPRRNRTAGTRPDLPSGLPTGLDLFPILPSFSSQSNLYTPVLDTLRATQPSSFTGGAVLQPTSASYF